MSSPHARIDEKVHIGPKELVMVLTGAGISAESGIPTFRDENGLWQGFRFEEVASIQAWHKHPHLVWMFYSMRRDAALQCGPNSGHFALVELERKLGDRFFLCTQNVDDLHEQAGSKRLVHMHGELFKSRCDRCSKPPFEDKRLYETADSIPNCQCGGRIRPHIVWFGESPFYMNRILTELDRCSLFICIGTSGAVQPAASFVRWARQRKIESLAPVRTIYIGPDEPENGWYFDHFYQGKAGEVLPELFRVE